VCAYCLVRRVRGPLSSLPPGRLLDHMRDLVEHGVKEVIFCGTRLGRYGHDLGAGASLARLATELESLSGDFRWRFSSLEPWDLDPDLVEALSGAKRFCKFFHLPLQSGSDDVLKRMKRPYRTADYLRLIESIKMRFPAARIGTDVIAGFPGETPAEFDESLAFLREAPLDYFHVFPFSHRPGLGTLPDEVRSSEINRRAAALKEMDTEKREIHRKNAIGRPMVALSIGERGILEDNLYCRFDTPQPPGVFVPCTVTGWEGASARVQLKV
jgi:threonylcarbamoyladenosine tRNA methylthiotransferase MtaB